MKRKRSSKKTIIIAIVLVMLSAGYFGSWKDSLLREVVYPMQYDYMVRQYAYENKVDTALVASVILAESKFNSQASSHRGAVGLMQIMPETGNWIAQEMNLNGYTPDQLNDVRTNIRMGTWYLGYLQREFDGNTILALAAYNAGRGHVDDWVKKYGWNKNFSEIDKIPFSETREYVKVVLQNEQQYKRLYDI